LLPFGLFVFFLLLFAGLLFSFQQILARCNCLCHLLLLLLFALLQRGLLLCLLLGGLLAVGLVGLVWLLLARASSAHLL
jgi:hypothetical protein